MIRKEKYECRVCFNDCRDEYSTPHADICDDCLADKLSKEVLR